METYTPQTEQSRLTSPTLWIEVNLGAIRHNFQTLKTFLNNDVSMMAVVKANAYGHGILPVAKALSDQADWYGVATIQEGILLRKEGLKQPVLVFGHPPLDELSTALEWDLTVSLSNADYAEEVDREAGKLGNKVKAHIKVDTGMGRLGIPMEIAERDILRILCLSHLELTGLYTHFPQAEKEADPFTIQQVRSFRELQDRLFHDGVDFEWVHAAGSSGIVNYEGSHFNLVRPGLMLYGLYTDLSLSEKISLKPALALKSKWIALKRMTAGQSVGYGRTFICERDTRIGVLPIGYSHGYAWGLGGKARVLFREKSYPLAGRVSMDTLCVDLGPETDANVGDAVTLMGREGDQVLSAHELAGLSGTIPYEVVTRLHPSIVRIYSES